jgi:hypothetical protein
MPPTPLGGISLHGCFTRCHPRQPTETAQWPVT